MSTEQGQYPIAKPFEELPVSSDIDKSALATLALGFLYETRPDVLEPTTDEYAGRLDEKVKATITRFRLQAAAGMNGPELLAGIRDLTTIIGGDYAQEFRASVKFLDQLMPAVDAPDYRKEVYDKASQRILFLTDTLEPATNPTAIPILADAAKGASFGPYNWAANKTGLELAFVVPVRKKRDKETPVTTVILTHSNTLVGREEIEKELDKQRAELVDGNWRYTPNGTNTPEVKFTKLLSLSKNYRRVVLNRPGVEERCLNKLKQEAIRLVGIDHNNDVAWLMPWLWTHKAHDVFDAVYDSFGVSVAEGAFSSHPEFTKRFADICTRAKHPELLADGNVAEHERIVIATVEDLCRVGSKQIKQGSKHVPSVRPTPVILVPTDPDDVLHGEVD
jgi:hypothetical protein